jgi:hypothetical protein
VAKDEKCKTIIMLHGISDFSSGWELEAYACACIAIEHSGLPTSRVIRLLKIQLLNAMHNFATNIFSFHGDHYML